MASHDFNKPCDCRECREELKHIICKNCNLIHVVVIDRTPKWSTDRKGLTGVDFLTPKDPDKHLSCECGYIVKNTGYYTSYNSEITKEAREYAIRKAEAKICDGCGKLEGIDNAIGFFEKIRLVEKDNFQFCQSCLADRFETESKDPSDENNKYKFDRKKLVWTLEKVKVPCKNCKKSRWLNAANQWKSFCLTCYRMRS